MRRILWLLLALVGLLAAACGSADEESTSEIERDGLAGEAPPVATSTATATTETAPVATVTSIATAEASAGDLGDRLDEMTLDEDDVPRGLTPMGEMTLDYDMETLGLAGLGSGKAHMTMFAGAGQQEMVVSMVILFEDSWAVEQALAQIDKVSADQIQDTFGMMGDFGGLQYEDLRELDVSDLGEGAFGFAMKFELPQIGAGDGQWVLFGRDSLLAMVMTMGMSGGAAADAVPLAEVMDAKIKDVILQ
jgi:hypothetical protein